MSLHVINGGLPQASPTPEHRKCTGTALERAQGDIVNRVAAAIHDADAGDGPHPAWEEWVDAAYDNADTNPGMLESVSDTIRKARAAIEAISPCAPDWDEAIFLDIGGDPAELCSTVQDWIAGVLK